MLILPGNSIETGDTQPAVTGLTGSFMGLCTRQFAADSSEHVCGQISSTREIITNSRKMARKEGGGI